MGIKQANASHSLMAAYDDEEMSSDDKRVQRGAMHGEAVWWIFLSTLEEIACVKLCFYSERMGDFNSGLILIMAILFCCESDFRLA